MPHHIRFGCRDSQTSSRTHRHTFSAKEQHTSSSLLGRHYSDVFPQYAYRKVDEISTPPTREKETICTASPEAAAKHLLETVAQHRLSVNGEPSRVHIERYQLPNGHKCCIALFAYSVDGHEGELTIHSNSHHEHEKTLLEALEGSAMLLKQAEEQFSQDLNVESENKLVEALETTIKDLIHVEEEHAGELAITNKSPTDCERTLIEESETSTSRREFTTERLHYKAYIEHTIKVQNPGGDLYIPTTIASRLSFHWEVSITKQELLKPRQLGWLVI
jgi:hypothetical protein